MNVFRSEGNLHYPGDQDQVGKADTLDEHNFSLKLRNENIQKRLQTLFAKNDEDDLDKSKNEIKEDIDDNYVTTYEPITTDTPFTSDGDEPKVERKAAMTKDEAAMVAKNIIEKQAGLVEHNSDEEVQ